MNNKENELLRITENVIKCCATQVDEQGTMSFTKEDVLGKSRAENVVMTRSMLVGQIISAGYSVSTVAKLLNRSVQAVRHLCELNYNYHRNSRAFRIAEAEATLLNRDLNEQTIGK